jgi:Ca2+-binding RTX toxin-like protein
MSERLFIGGIGSAPSVLPTGYSNVSSSITWNVTSGTAALGAAYTLFLVDTDETGHATYTPVGTSGSVGTPAYGHTIDLDFLLGPGSIYTTYVSIEAISTVSFDYDGKHYTEPYDYIDSGTLNAVMLFTSGSDKINFNVQNYYHSVGDDIHNGKGGADDVTLPDRVNYALSDWTDDVTFSTGSKLGEAGSVVRAGDGNYNVQLGAGSDGVLGGAGTTNVFIGSGPYDTVATSSDYRPQSAASTVVDHLASGIVTLVNGASFSLNAAGIQELSVGDGGSAVLDAILNNQSTVSFDGYRSTITLKAEQQFENQSSLTISNFHSSDHLNLSLSSIGRIYSLNYGNNSLAIIDDGNKLHDITLAGPLQDANLVLAQASGYSQLSLDSTVSAGPSVNILAALANDVYETVPIGANISGWNASTALDGAVTARVGDHDVKFVIKNGTITDGAFQAQLYSSGDQKHYVIAVRGTDNASDLFTDLAGFVNGPTIPTAALITATADTTELIKLFMNKIGSSNLYNGTSLVLTGHSLGGAIAQLEGEAAGIDTISFNAPGAEQLRAQLSSYLSSNVGAGQVSLINYRNVGDVVSQSGSLGASEKVETIQSGNGVVPGIWSAHLIDTIIQNISTADYKLSAGSPDGHSLSNLLLNYIVPAAVNSVSDRYIINFAASAGSALIDPAASNTYLFNETPDSPLLTTVTLVSASHVANFYVTQQVDGIWSTPVLVTPDTTLILHDNVHAIEFEAVDASGSPVSLPADYAFGVSFGASGNVTATLDAGPTVRFTLAGSSGNDVLSGGQLAEVIIGGGGADLLTGGAGADTFKYLAISDSTATAYDTVTDFQTGIDKFDLRSVSASLVTLKTIGLATDISTDTGLQIHSNNAVGALDLLLSAGVNTSLIGDAASNTIIGGAGNDVITGLGGGDILTGGTGRDTFVYTSATDSTQAAPDFITDFSSGTDKIDLSAIGVNHISTIFNGAAEFLFIETKSGQMMQINVAGTVEPTDIVGTTTNYYIQGDDGNNYIYGGAGNDVIDGHGGNDVIIGGGSSDALFGGTGQDTFKYLAVSDSLQGSGADTIFDFASGQDQVDLTALGINHISTIDNGTAEFVFIETKSGTLMQINFVGVDVAKPGDFNVTGGTNYYIQGDEGNNTLIGGNGKDVIDGHGGNDVIIGGGNTDALFGGAGSDTFKYLAASDSTPGAPDTIFDFASGTDKIDLTAVHTSSKDVFNILVSGGASYIFVDLGGDGTNDMLIQATGTVTASDILWNKPGEALASPASAAPPMHTDEVSAYQFTSDFAPDQGEFSHAWNTSIFQAHTMQPSDLLHV